jgi:hypothetical protein
MTKGDIVLITFPFTDLSGTKLRPAVILIETAIASQYALSQHKHNGRSHQI